MSEQLLLAVSRKRCDERGVRGVPTSAGTKLVSSVSTAMSFCRCVREEEKEKKGKRERERRSSTRASAVRRAERKEADLLAPLVGEGNDLTVEGLGGGLKEENEVRRRSVDGRKREREGRSRTSAGTLFNCRAARPVRTMGAGFLLYESRSE